MTIVRFDTIPTDAITLEIIFMKSVFVLLSISSEVMFEVMG